MHLDHYSDGPVHYPGHCSVPHQHEMDQPLDLTMSRSPRPGSTGSLVSGGEGGGLAKRPRLEEPSRAPSNGRAGHLAMCMVKGCRCDNARPVVHPVHHQSYSSRHRHSPYPQYSPPGHRSPAMGEAQPSSHRLTYSLPRPPSPSSTSSPALMMRDGSSPSPYFPPHHQDRRCRSPYGSGRLVTSSSSSLSPYGGDVMRQGPSPGALLCPPGSSSSPLPVSPRPRDNSPRPSSRTPSRVRDVSPRPAIYRPFEDASPSSSDISSSVGVVAVERYRGTSEDDLLASSSLLSLSYTSSSGSRSSQQSSDSAWRGYSRQGGEELQMEGNEQGDAKPTQSDAGRSTAYHRLPSSPPPPLPPHYYTSQAVPAAGGRERCDGGSAADSHSGSPTEDSSRQLGPAQDHAVASSSPSSDLTDSTTSAGPARAENKDRNKQQLESRFVKVVGTTPLSIVRAKRAERQAKVSKEHMKALLDRCQERHNADSNDSEGGSSSDQNSSSGSGQDSPRSSSDGGGSEGGDVGRGFPIPPDPNLKMSALDYLISEFLVKNIDKPFKPCNTEIEEIYAGTRKGRLTLVDLIELQVEASLKA